MAISRSLICVSFLSALWLAGCAGLPFSNSSQTSQLPQTLQSSQPVAAETYSSQKLAEYMSSGNVQVYELDSMTESSGAGFPDALDEQFGGYPYAGDTRVTVYSLDRDTKRPPGMVSSSRGEYLSPFQHSDNILAPDEGTISWSDLAGLEPDQYERRDTNSGVISSAPLPAMTRGKAGKIYFRHGGTNLDQADKKILGHIVEDMARQPSAVFVIEGHASRRAEVSDPTQKRLVNLETSLKRAYNVSRELITRGVPATSLRTVGVGDTSRDTDASDEASERASRRVEIYKAR